jgi:hypothetical protein
MVDLAKKSLDLATAWPDQTRGISKNDVLAKPQGNRENSMDDTFEDPKPLLDGRNSLAVMQAVYRDDDLPLSTRMKAAAAALPYEFPKLAVTALVQEGSSFADKIEAARRRSEGILEARFQEEVERRLALRLAPPAVTYSREPLPQGRAPTPLTAPFQRMRRS